jgi:hypothetical protein
MNSQKYNNLNNHESPDKRLARESKNKGYRKDSFEEEDFQESRQGSQGNQVSVISMTQDSREDSNRPVALNRRVADKEESSI